MKFGWVEYLLMVRKYNSMVRNSKFLFITLGGGGGELVASVYVPQCQ